MSHQRTYHVGAAFRRPHGLTQPVIARAVRPWQSFHEKNLQRSFRNDTACPSCRERSRSRTKTMPWEIASCHKTMHDADVLMIVDCLESDEESVFIGIGGDFQLGI